MSNIGPETADFDCRIRVRVSGPTFDTLFMVRVRVRVICGYDVIINMCTAVRINLTFYGGVDHPPNRQIIQLTWCACMFTECVCAAT